MLFKIQSDMERVTLPTISQEALDKYVEKLDISKAVEIFEKYKEMIKKENPKIVHYARALKQVGCSGHLVEGFLIGALDYYNLLKEEMLRFNN